jgi:hypothetical protein
MLLTEYKLRKIIRNALKKENTLKESNTGSTLLATYFYEWIIQKTLGMKGHVTDGNRKDYQKFIESYNKALNIKKGDPHYVDPVNGAKTDYWQTAFSGNITSFEDFMARSTKEKIMSVLGLISMFDPTFAVDIIIALLFLTEPNGVKPAILTLLLPTALVTIPKLKNVTMQAIRNKKTAVNFQKAQRNIDEIKKVWPKQGEKLQKEFDKLKDSIENQRSMLTPAGKNLKGNKQEAELKSLEAWMVDGNLKEETSKLAKEYEKALKTDGTKFTKGDVPQSATSKVKPFTKDSTGVYNPGYKLSDGTDVLADFSEEFYALQKLKKRLENVEGVRAIEVSDYLPGISKDPLSFETNKRFYDKWANLISTRHSTSLKGKGFLDLRDIPKSHIARFQMEHLGNLGQSLGDFTVNSFKKIEKLKKKPSITKGNKLVLKRLKQKIEKVKKNLYNLQVNTSLLKYSDDPSGFHADLNTGNIWVFKDELDLGILDPYPIMPKHKKLQGILDVGIASDLEKLSTKINQLDSMVKSIDKLIK